MTLLLLLPETGPQTTPPPPSGDAKLRTLLGVGLTLAFGFVLCLI